MADEMHDREMSYRRGWLTADDVINTRSLADLRRLLPR
jgi:hypothetical protein